MNFHSSVREFVDTVHFSVSDLRCYFEGVAFQHSNALEFTIVRGQLLLEGFVQFEGGGAGLVVGGDDDIPLIAVVGDLDDGFRLQERSSQFGMTGGFQEFLEILVGDVLVFSYDLYHL